MRPLYRNIFFFLGIAAVALMLFTLDTDYLALWAHIRKAGWWFVLVVGVWVAIYLLNALSWYCIIRAPQDSSMPKSGGGQEGSVPFATIYKLTISGFALNYATPCGLMGGEPYRIMELSPIIGKSRATSSVILYVMMHIFSHICFWLASAVLYIIMYARPGAEMRQPLGVWLLVGAVVAFCIVAIYFFMRGYKHGLIIKTLHTLGRVPWLGKYARRFVESKQEQLLRIDRQIAELHSQHGAAFYRSFAFEFCARVMTALEIYFILRILTSDVNFLDCVLIMAFTSLFGNIFFFSPMQLGAREGGFALSVSALSLSSAFGVYTGLITRLREIIWIIIGLALIKVGNRTNVRIKSNKQI